MSDKKSQTPNNISRPSNIISGYANKLNSNSKESNYSFATDVETKGDERRRKNTDKDNRRNLEALFKPDSSYLNRNYSGQPLSDSKDSKTSSHSYMTIIDYPTPEPRRRNAKNKRPSQVNCRIIKIGVVIAVLAGLGVIMYFILHNFLGKDSCDKLSSVEHGNVSMSDESRATIHCEEGYGPPANTISVTCHDGKWNTAQPCPVVICESYPTVDNGVIEANGNTYGSEAHLKCLPGFMLKETATLTCTQSGNWSGTTELGCIPHPCGPYNLPDHVLIAEDFSHINMTISLTCVHGFSLIPESDTYMECENSTWKNNPACEITGHLSLVTKNDSILVTGRPLSISCHLTLSTTWDTVYLSRNLSGTDDTPYLVATMTSDGVVVDKLDEATDVHENVTTSPDGVAVMAIFSQIQCADSGLYTCAVLVGNLKESIGNKTTSRQFHVIDVSSQFEAFSPDALLSQGEESVVRCTGRLGMGQNGTKLAELSIKILYGTENPAETLPSIIESSYVEDCQIVETINATIRVTNTMNGAELLCLIESSGTSAKKRSEILKVSTTTVFISTSSSIVNIGEGFNISTELDNIRGWEVMEVRRVCNNNTIVIARVEHIDVDEEANGTSADDTLSSRSHYSHILISDIAVTETTARIRLNVNGSMCIDACGEGGKVNYTSAVKLSDSWAEESVEVDFQVKPTAPLLTNVPEVFHRGQESIISCIGNVGIPSGEMKIREDSQIINDRLLGSATYFDSDTCQNERTLKYDFIVSEGHDGTEFSCEVSTNSESLMSEKLIVKVADPILYFTEDSHHGELGKSKTIQCVLTSVPNLTTVEMNIHSTEGAVCNISVTGQGIISATCTHVSGWSAYGSFSEDMTVFTTTFTQQITCDSEGLYICQTNTMAKTEMYFKVTGNFSVPYLRLPETLVEDQPILYEDILSCTADLGYPVDGKTLQIQIKRRDSVNFENYDLSSTATGCQNNATKVLRSLIFDSSSNGSIFRCVILNDDGNVIASSTEQEMKLLKNICLNESTGDYHPHPYNCRRYVRCVNTLLYDHVCATGSCALTDSDPICNAHCSGCN